MNTATVLTIEQILRAAQLLEQQQQQQQNQDLIDPMTYCKLGQDYENRLITPKMRTPDLIATGSGPLNLQSNGSTGSSRRSSPLHSSSSQMSSSPNSPIGVLLPASTAMRASAKSSCASVVGVAPMLTCRGASSIAASASSPSSSQSSASHSTRQSRAAHNELEKNRRANLRSYLELLKSVLPAEQETSRDTTLSLLTRARNYLRYVKQQKQSVLAAKEEALNENARLRARLDEMRNGSAAITAQQSLIQLAPDAQEPTQRQEVEPMEQQIQPECSIAHVEQLVVKPEPQMPLQNLYNSAMELSPSAKPPTTTTATSTLEGALSALLSLQAALNPSVTSALLNNLLAANAQTAAPHAQTNNLLYTAFRPTPIDLIQEGLLPALPLLYPYTNYSGVNDQIMNGNMNSC